MKAAYIEQAFKELDTPRVVQAISLNRFDAVIIRESG
jgi:hypothetical protein